MSISVALDELRAAIADTDRAPYLLTVSDDGRAHTVAVAPQWNGDDELVIAVGRRTAANAQARPLVSLLWPPKERAGYSLIVDAEVTTTASDDDGHIVHLRPTRAVLHRPAPGLAEGAYEPDCVTVPLD